MRAAFALLLDETGPTLQRASLTVACFFLFWAAIPRGFAAPNDCIGDSPDGRLFCGASKTTPFTYSLCYENAPAFWRDNAMCYARGGTPGPNGTCPGSTPDTEDNLAQRAVAYAQYLTGSSCTLSSDSSWDVAHSSNWCWNANGPIYNEGQLVATLRAFVACAANQQMRDCMS